MPLARTEAPLFRPSSTRPSICPRDFYFKTNRLSQSGFSVQFDPIPLLALQISAFFNPILASNQLHAANRLQGSNNVRHRKPDGWGTPHCFYDMCPHHAASTTQIYFDISTTLPKIIAYNAVSYSIIPAESWSRTRFGENPGLIHSSIAYKSAPGLEMNKLNILLIYSR